MIVVKPGVHCQWWMDCLRPATTTREHPIYGPVPICQGHNDDADDMEGKI